MKRSSTYNQKWSAPRRIMCREWANTYSRRGMWAVPGTEGAWVIVNRRNATITYTWADGSQGTYSPGEHINGPAWHTPAAVVTDYSGGDRIELTPAGRAWFTAQEAMQSREYAAWCQRFHEAPLSARGVQL